MEIENYIQLETKQVEFLVNNVKNTKELYTLANEDYENKVLEVYNGQSILYSKHGLAWIDSFTPCVLGPFTAVFESPGGTFVLVYESVKNWLNDEENDVKRYAYKFFLEHEFKHLSDWNNPFFRHRMKNMYNLTKLNTKMTNSFELRADKQALKYLKKTYPNKIIVRTLMFVYKFLSFNINQLNANIRAHREFALKFLVENRIAPKSVTINLIKQQAEEKFSRSEERLDNIEQRLKIFEKEIQKLNSLGTITMDA